MGDRGLIDAMRGAESVVVDSSVVLSYLDGGDRFSPAATSLFEHVVRDAGVQAILSTITVTETLVRPMRAGAAPIVEDFLRNWPNLALADVDFRTAREAARFRAATGLKTPDAIVIAPAITAGVAHIVSTNDRWRAALRSAPGLRLIHLSEFVSAP